MTVMAMEVVSAEKHPNADALRLYKMRAAERVVEIIANLDNIYELGDTVVIALAGSILKDGTTIKPTKLRGVYSYGMALGKVEADVGQDLSALYCQPDNPALAKKLPFVKWTNIELLYNVKRELDALDRAPQIIYRAKVKLHGTNAGVRVTPAGEVAAQKRSQIISSDSDNAGFAAWVAKNTNYFSQLKGDSDLTIFGEWCGNSIQKGVAISQIKRRVFAVFAIQYGGTGEEIAKLEIRPEAIREILPPHEDIFVLPYYGQCIELDFGNVKKLQAAAETINEMVEAVETIDPWVKDNFGIEGVGEGLVLYPQAEDLVDRNEYTKLIFKAKGEKHQSVKTKKAVQLEPEVAQSIAEFVELFVTEARLQQALSEACGGELNRKLTGEFIKWIATDIHKESEAELAAANLTWKQVSRFINSAASKWYGNKVTDLS